MSTPTPSPTPAEQFLASELAAARQSLQRTRLAGIVIIVIVAGYMGVVTKSLKNHLEPQAAADYATMVVAEQVQEKTDLIATQVRERIPALVASLPDYVKHELPGYREKLEEQLEEDFREHSQATAKQLGKHLDDFLTAHVVQIRALLKMVENRPEEFESLAPDLEKEILSYLEEKPDGEESLKHKIDPALAELQKIEQKMDHLAKGVKLTPQEQKVRHAIAIIANNAEEHTRELQMQIRDALKKAQ